MINPFIDAHVHLNTPSVAKMEKAAAYGASFLSINTDIPFFEPVTQQEQKIHQLNKNYPGRVKYLTTFTVEDWESPSWPQKALDQVKRGLDNGAAGVKIWKNIGMELRDKQGNFIMVDDERLDPLIDYVATHNFPLMGHQGEPRNCWLPLEKMTVNSDREYFAGHPEYHMFLHPEYPSYEIQIQARDNMLSKHPGLRFVGAHLGSLEWDLGEVARRLDRFPNMMVDLAERICHVQLQARSGWQAVHDFMTRYQDRIIYGTDVIDDGSMDDPTLTARFENLWKFHWEFFSTNHEMEAPEFEGSFRGLALPEEVTTKIFRENAAKTYGF